MTIEAIKSQLLLLDVLAHYDLRPDRNGRLCCPFHADKTPSLQVYAQTNTAYCFSTNCSTHGKSMDVIDFVMHKEKCSKHEAIMAAKAMLGKGKTDAPAKLKSLPRVADTRTTFLSQMFSYFQRGVINSGVVKRYLESRHLNAELIELGYNSGQFHHGSRKNEVLINHALKYGLLTEREAKSRTGGVSYGVFAKACVVFALRNRRGHVVGMYFRSTSSSKNSRHFYLKDRQGLYPAYPKLKTRQLILTESVIDAATLCQITPLREQYGLLALYGTNGLTDEHQKAISELAELEEIIFAFDGDEAGRKAVAKYAPMFQAEYPNLRLTQLRLPEGEDINNLANQGPQVYWELLQARVTVEAGADKVPAVVDVMPTLVATEPAKEAPTLLDTHDPKHIKYTGEVINPFAHQIKLPQGAHKIRRLNELYQSFVRQITLLNQYQRKTDKQGRLITQKEDLQVACDILFESIILKVDELNGSLRQFFERLKAYVKAEAREFTQREVRQALQVSKSQLQRHLQSLLEYGYVYQSGGYLNRGLRYRIDYWDNHHKTRAGLRDYLGRQLEKL